MRVALLRLIVGMAAFLCALPVHACTCVEMVHKCGDTQAPSTLFLGEVIARRSVKIPAHLLNNSMYYTTENVFRVRVHKSISGTPRSNDEIEVSTGPVDGDCVYPLEVGRSYLIDAYDLTPQHNEGVKGLDGVHLGTGICAHTRPEADADAELAAIRATEIEQASMCPTTPKGPDGQPLLVNKN